MSVDAAARLAPSAQGAQPEAASAPEAAVRKLPARRRRRRFSPILLRVLVVNLLPVLLLAGGVLYLDRYQQSLIESELDSLAVQADLIASAIGESAVTTEPEEVQHLATDTARQLVRRLVANSPSRARLYGPTGELVADSRLLVTQGGLVQIEVLAPLTPSDPVRVFLDRTYNWMFDWLPRRGELTLYTEAPLQRAEHYEEARSALRGQPRQMVRLSASGELVLSAAVPVQRYREILGVLMLSIETGWIDDAVRSVRFDILRVFGVALAVTILLSFYMAGTIARPIRLLALAAERVRTGHSRQNAIPDFSHRGDEIGDLSASLKAMTEALWARLDAIERFAADVAHELKNPLTSVRSAIETAVRLKDPEQQRKLMALVLEDVQRLDRLISDISQASRLDSELLRAEFEEVEIGRILAALVDVHGATRAPDAPRLVLEEGAGADLAVRGIERRLVQVFRNLIVNALSFSPPERTVTLAASGNAEEVMVTVEDAGPGIPEGKLDSIFERFYSERPKGEKFGIHSGLGLSISKQIVEAHGGGIQAQNRRDAEGRISGARFVVRLPRR
ncbi:MAG: stimulus-sensing domain-containing protein [Proteobacteria bacterium]|nr:stimulus-sensing domain-containing protein [Pseudomonadota bacterium]MBI3498456.1 stimulus-sensing domain-containing protein [Pseudomonadota bacterium]